MRISWILLIFFIVEVILLIEIGGSIGILLTFIEFITTAMLGGYIVRNHGLGILNQVRNAVNSGESPEINLMDGLLVIIAGVLLIIPGFASDIISLFLLFPTVRTLFFGKIHHNLDCRAQKNKKRTTIVIDQMD